jgi:CheY-like chemotaxis protein
MARILLADDDRTSLETARRGLELDGHAVLAVEDGVAALARIEAGETCDVLVSDVQMPGLDGITLAARALAARPGLRILMVSGYPEVLSRAAVLGAGVRRLPKPFTIEQLRTEVRELLRSP